MTMTPVARAALSLLFAAGLQACGSSSESKAGAVVNLQTLTSTIPVTRAACTPFGAAPSVVSAALDGTVNPSCLPGGEKIERWQDAAGTMGYPCLSSEERCGGNEVCSTVRAWWETIKKKKN